MKYAYSRLRTPSLLDTKWSENPRQNLYQLCFFICTLGSSKFSGLSGPGPGHQVSQGPRSVRLAEKTVGPMLLQFLCLCVISSKPVSWGGIWWYMILDHTHLRFCLKSQKMRAASVEFRGVNEKDHCVQQFNHSKLPLLPFQNNLHVYSLVRDTELECIDVHM